MDISVRVLVHTLDDMFVEFRFRYAEYAVLMVLSPIGPNI